VTSDVVGVEMEIVVIRIQGLGVQFPARRLTIFTEAVPEHVELTGNR
jgi:hypothetical protein